MVRVAPQRRLERGTSSRLNRKTAVCNTGVNFPHLAPDLSEKCQMGKGKLTTFRPDKPGHKKTPPTGGKFPA